MASSFPLRSLSPDPGPSTFKFPAFHPFLAATPPNCKLLRIPSFQSLRKPRAFRVFEKMSHRERTEESSAKEQTSDKDIDSLVSSFMAVAKSDLMVEKKVEQNMAKRGKKGKVSRAEVEMRVRLDMCSKRGDVMGALLLYDSAVRDGVKLEQYHYNVLLYLCASAAIEAASRSEIAEKVDSDDEEITSSGNKKRDISIQVSEDVREYARKRGFEIYAKMCLEKIPMTEAALTSIARIAMSIGNGDMAFDIVKQMKRLGITPKLRSYGPALLTFCNNGDIEKAFEVVADMLMMGVCPEEPELEALLRASVSAGQGDKVYYVLHKLRAGVRQVSPSTVNLIEEWFKSATASRLGKRKWDADMVARAMENGGGGWHGLGWLGKGRWTVKSTHVHSNGVCLGCGEKLVTIDLDPVETEHFASSVAYIVCSREKHSSFQKFQKWLDYYGPFEAVVDAANVGLFSQRRFSINKVNAVFNGIRQNLPSKKWPLIILHHKRLSGGRMEGPINGKLIEKWKNADCIYATPTGSNDDWYWLYAAIKCRSLIITNDEMRDHIFLLLGNDFFPRWKERHQVRFNYQDGSFEFHMPPPYSVVIQESEKGHWHIPISLEHESREERTWLCVTRANSYTARPKSSIPDQGDGESKGRRLLSTNNTHQQNLPFSRPSPEDVVRNSKAIADGEFMEHSSIFRKIEAAEKLCGCVIDFQI